MNDVHLHIEALVLEGFAPGDRARIADGVTRELERLVAGGVPAEWRRPLAIERVAAAPVTIAHASSPERVGETVARSIYRAAGNADGTAAGNTAGKDGAR